jgi:23S rRNA (uracil1939-C5)-methyltransferase
MLNTQDIIKVKAHDIDYQGQGVCRHENQVIFIKGLITDEEAEVKIIETKKNYAIGEIVKLTKTSQNRIKHEQIKLGACDLMHLSIDQQYLWQTKTIKDTFKKIANVIVEPKAVIGGNHQHYRNKVVLHVMQSQKLKLGMYDKTNKKLIEVDTFILATKHINKAIKQLLSKPIEIGYDVLKHIVFRSNQKGEVLITLVATDSHFKGIEALLEHIKSIENIVGLSLNIQDRAKHILGDTSFTLFGINELTENIKDITLYLDDRSFFQINHEVMLKTYEQIYTFIDQDEQVIDAFCGVGGIGFYVQDKASSVVMIDHNEQNTKNAMKTKFIHRLGNVEVIKEDIEKYQMTNSNLTLIVDPPRSGLDQKFINHLISIKPKKIVYLSCDVKTMARDVGLLNEIYDIIDVYPVAMFPNTTSIETLVFLRLKN